jgi:putative ABC transport system permease protein
MGSIFVRFIVLAIIIACLGLFALVAYAAEQRKMGIGIRKVLRADISTIVLLLSKKFIKLVTIATVIATPAAGLIMQNWLEGFAYRQRIQLWSFAAVNVITVLIAFITICFQSGKSALANPHQNPQK